VCIQATCLCLCLCLCLVCIHRENKPPGAPELHQSAAGTKQCNKNELFFSSYFLTQKKNEIQGSRAPLTSKLHQSVSEVLSAMHIRHLNEVRWCNSETCVHMSLRGSLSYMCAYLNVCPLVLYLRRFFIFLFLHVCILECMSVGALLVRWCFTYVEMHVDMLAYVF